MIWHIYFWLFAALLVGTTVGRSVLFFVKPGSVSVRDILFSLPGLGCVIALYGYLHNLTLGPNAIWIILVCVLPILYVIEMRSDETRAAVEKLGLKKALLVFGASFLFTLPGYIASVLYALRTR
jgi:hypothetical protein